jgi:hypothetical protein
MMEQDDNNEDLRVSENLQMQRLDNEEGIDIATLFNEDVVIDDMLGSQRALAHDHVDQPNDERRCGTNQRSTFETLSTQPSGRHRREVTASFQDVGVERRFSHNGAQTRDSHLAYPRSQVITDSRPVHDERLLLQQRRSDYAVYGDEYNEDIYDSAAKELPRDMDCWSPRMIDRRKEQQRWENHIEDLEKQIRELQCDIDQKRAVAVDDRSVRVTEGLSGRSAPVSTEIVSRPDIDESQRLKEFERNV